ncbi:MAG: hypothetical protein ACLP8S_15660 [Solirubrobacteraceae bacterium]
MRYGYIPANTMVPGILPAQVASAAFLVDVDLFVVLNAEAGRPLLALRSGDLRRRVGEVHDVVERDHLLAEQDPGATSRLLAAAPSRGQSAVDALCAGRPETAYLAAIDALRPRPTGMLTGSRPRRSGATAALHD